MSDDDREPVAWLACATDGRDNLAEVFLSEDKAKDAARVWQGRVTPLFFTPTLTAAEREAIETAALEAEAQQHSERAATLRGLLERLETVKK